MEWATAIKTTGIAVVIVGIIALIISLLYPHDYLLLISIVVVVLGFVISLIGALLEAKPKKSLTPH